MEEKADIIKIYGTLENISWREERNGNAAFEILDINGVYRKCRGILMPFPMKIPVSVKGTVKDDVLSVSSIKLECRNRNVFGRFLESVSFEGIGTAYSGLIMDVIESSDVENYYNFFRKNDTVSLLVGAGVPQTAAGLVAAKINKYVFFEDLYNIVTESGGDLFNAHKLYKKYGDNSINVVKENPYVLCLCGADYVVSERLAKEKGMPAYSKKRINAILRYAMEMNHNWGNTRIESKKLVRLINNIEKRAGMGYRTDPYYIAFALNGNPSYVMEKDNGERYVYFTADYENERNITREICRLNNSAVILGHSETTVDNIENELGIKYSPGQRNAFNAILKSGISIITGGPGTGKTTTLNGILMKYEIENPGNKIALCSPTGCAAKRMQDATGRDASTIHRLLGLNPYTEITGEYTMIDADLVVVDECSMLDTMLFSRLLKGIKNGGSLLMIGDRDQLESVGAGNVFSDLISSGKIPVFQLDTIYRQKNGSLIIENSRNILNGNIFLNQSNNTFKVVRCEDSQSLMHTAVSMAAGYEKVFGGKCVKVFTPVRDRKFVISSFWLNRSIKKEVNPDSEKDADNNIYYGSYIFSVGDQIMFTKNNRDKSYYNGETAVIKNIQKHGYRSLMSVETEDGDTISLSDGEYDDIDLSYAITAHKAQGSECDYALVVIPKEPRPLLRRKLLYVEVTRAKKQVVILSEKNALEEAIINTMEHPRVTGLKRRLLSV